MPTVHRLLTLLGGAAAAVLAAFLAPMALGHADTATGPYETCDDAVCLVQPAGLDGWNYSGIRPWITDWHSTQPYDVVVNGENVGSYSITAEDTWTPLYWVWHYTYGDFTPSVAGSDPDLGAFAGLSGAQVYSFGNADNSFQTLTLDDIVQHGHELTYQITKIGDFTNTNVIDPVDHTSADYIQVGDAAPQFLYNSLFHGEFFPTPPDYLVPADQFAAPDFDPGDFVGHGLF